MSSRHSPADAPAPPTAEPEEGALNHAAQDTRADLAGPASHRDHRARARTAGRRRQCPQPAGSGCGRRRALPTRPATTGNRQPAGQRQERGHAAALFAAQRPRQHDALPRGHEAAYAARTHTPERAKPAFRPAGPRGHARRRRANFYTPPGHADTPGDEHRPRKVQQALRTQPLQQHDTAPPREHRTALPCTAVPDTAPPCRARRCETLSLRLPEEAGQWSGVTGSRNEHTGRGRLSAE